MQLSLGNIEIEGAGEEPATVRRQCQIDVHTIEQLKQEKALLQDQQIVFRQNLDAADQDL
jgi:hypothetical protein